MQVFHDGRVLSFHEALTTFLTDMTLPEYQAYAHLKRAGFAVTRHVQLAAPQSTKTGNVLVASCTPPVASAAADTLAEAMPSAEKPSRFSAFWQTIVSREFSLYQKLTCFDLDSSTSGFVAKASSALVGTADAAPGRHRDCC